MSDRKLSRKNFIRKRSAFTILEFLIFFCVTVFVVAGVYFVKQMTKVNDVKSLIMQIRKYDDAVAAFAEKYDAFPGDVCDTKTYGITTENTDGNCDNIVSDRAQEIISANGEITNFWMHLSKTKMISEIFDGKENEKAKIGTTFPISKIGDKIGIIAYGDEGKTFYQVGFKYSNHNRIFMSNNSLKTFEAYWFDEKIDDGNPRKGRVVAAGKNSLNILENEDCVKFSEYDRTNNDPVCQLRIEIK